MNTDLKTAAAYIRVSTADQTELSPDSQIKVVRQYAKQHGFIIPKEFIYRDDGISGRHADKRPEFNAMIAASKQKPSPFSAVLLWKFSRFARNQEESIFYKSMLRRNGVEVISVSEPAVDGPFGTLIERIIEWSDEYYSIRLSGEVKRGMTEKVERGGAVSVAPFGYAMVEKQLIPNPETFPLVQKIFSDYLSGKSIIAIARELNALGIKTTRGNPWENRTVEYILYNPVYIGKIRWNPKRRTRRDYNDPDIMITQGIHEPIIDEETFNAVQEKLAEQKKRYSYYRHEQAPQEHMLRSLVKCSSCGASLTMSASGQGLQCCKYVHGKCGVSHYISLKKAEALVLAAIETAFKTKSFDLTVKQAYNDAAAPDYAQLIEKEKKKLSRIKEAYEDGVYTVEELRESRKAIDERIAQLKKLQTPSKPNMQKLRKKFADEHQNILPILKNPNTPGKEKNELMLSFVDKIIYNRQNSTFQLFFYS